MRIMTESEKMLFVALELWELNIQIVISNISKSGNIKLKRACNLIYIISSNAVDQCILGTGVILHDPVSTTARSPEGAQSGWFPCTLFSMFQVSFKQ